MDDLKSHYANNHEAQILDEQQGQRHHPSDGATSSSTFPAHVDADDDVDDNVDDDIAVVMKQLQKALTKIENLEDEVDGLKSNFTCKKNGKGKGKVDTNDNVNTTDIISKSRTSTRHQDEEVLEDNVSETLVPDIPVRVTNRRMKNSSPFAVSFDLNQSNPRAQAQTQQKKDRQVSSLRARSLRQKLHVGNGQDEEQNIGESFLSSKRNMNMDMGTSNMISKVDIESGATTCTSSSEKLHFLQHKYEQLLGSIDEIRKEQTRTNEELRSLVSNTSEQSNDLSRIQTSNTPGDRNRVVKPEISLRKRNVQSSMFDGRSVKPGMFSGLITMFGRAPSVLLDGEMITSLDEDTFSLMMICPVGSKPWILGGFSFGFQMTLGIMIAIDQLDTSRSGSILKNVPFQVRNSFFRVAQVLSIILSLSTQSDILTSIRSFVLLGRGSNWAEIIGEEQEGRMRPSIGLWAIRVGLPNVLKLSQGLVVTFVSFIIIVENKETIPLLKDFTSLMIISEFDNILFHLAAYGYLGEELLLETERITDIAVTTNTSVIARQKKRNDIVFVRLAFVFLLMTMFAGWGTIFRMQEVGIIFDTEFPDCGHFKLASEKFYDGKCYGGPFNTLKCRYEDGDCSNFNTEYPNCNGNGLENLLNVEEKVGDGHCNKDFNIPQCEYDGGDCCSYKIHLDPSFGDGICNGGGTNTAGCLYDNGDCDSFNYFNPECPLDELSKIESSANVFLGNGICEGGGYNIDTCGFEFGDCAKAQIGQDLVLRGVLSPYSDKIDFDLMMSSDGFTILIGMPNTDSRGKYDLVANGTMDVYVYNSTTASWIDAGVENKIFLKEYSMTMNGNGSVVAVGSPRNPDFGTGVVGIYNHFNLLPSQVLSGGNQNSRFGSQLDLTDDGLRIAISSPWRNDKKGNLGVGMIQIFEKGELQQDFIPVGDEIYGLKAMELIGLYVLRLSSFGKKRVFFGAHDSGQIDVNHSLIRVYEFNEISQKWIQLGTDVARLTTTTEEQRTLMATTFSADGNRFAASYYSKLQSSHPGEISIYEWDQDLSSIEGTWKKVGSTISSKSNGFGRSMSMNTDGTLLVTSTVDPSCDGQNGFEHGLSVSADLCNTGSFQLYRYKPTNPPHRLFSQIPMLSQSIMEKQNRVKDDKIIGLQVSLSGDGSTLAISGYNLGQDFGYVKVYNVSEIFYIDCIVKYPNLIGDGKCVSHEPYYTASCGFDGGDCPLPSPAEGYSDDCKVAYPSWLNDEVCGVGLLPYNSKQCRYEGGACPPPSSVEGYPNCFASFPEKIGNEICDDFSPYNSYDCGFDGGDCLEEF